MRMMRECKMECGVLTGAPGGVCRKCRRRERIKEGRGEERKRREDPKTPSRGKVWPKMEYKQNWKSEK